MCEQEPEKLLDKLEQYQIPTGLDRWLTRSRPLMIGLWYNKIKFGEAPVL